MKISNDLNLAHIKTSIKNLTNTISMLRNKTKKIQLNLNLKIKLSVINSIVFFLLVQLILTPIKAETPIERFTTSSLMKNANVSVMIKNLETDKTICAFRPDNVAIPASTLKLVTTATALEMLGADFRFQTKLEIDGELSPEGILNGNLYIHGGGDPTLGSKYIGDPDFLAKWVNAVKNAGISKINGQIIADESLYEDEGVNPHWTWEDIGNYYAAGAYGISYLDNTFALILNSGAVGTTPQIIRTEPEMPLLNIDNHLISSTIDFDSAYFHGAPHSNSRVLRGEIPANRREFIVKGDIPNPGLLLAEHFQNELIKNGVAISQPPTNKNKNTNARKLIFSQDSPPLKDIITQTNIRSINLFAESIFRYLALKHASVASTRDAIREVRNFWISKGFPVDELFMNDGCGLSATDAVSADFLVHILEYMKTKSQNQVEFYNSLPVAGENGTLKKFLAKTHLQGKVHAKSGTISGVKTYAGYVESNSKTYAFAILVNHGYGSSKNVTTAIEELLLKTFPLKTKSKLKHTRH
jgi:D-alanyl-D-alanine carboxypeptidase/D-alanyl-D-alanine-endopeptidase (penicillin-binding protein 4)